MKKIYTKYYLSSIILLSILVSFQHLTAQQMRYTNQIFDKTDTLKEVEYARAEWLNNPVTLFANNNILVHDGENITEERPLFMDIFMPHEDTVSKRPVIIFMHSGGFLQGSRLNEDMVAMCDSFAQKGYVTATIDYRLGMGASVSWLGSIPLVTKVDEINGYRAAYRGMQDTRAAIRFLKHNAEIYGIDTTKIYLTGSSAGAILALNNIYLGENEIANFAYATPSLGNLDTVGIQGYGSKANAITSLWGAIEIPEIIENDSTPIFLVHGTEDNIVPYKKGVPLKALIPEAYKDIIQLNLPETYGSFCIDTALNNRNISHETYFVEGKKHEFYGVATGEFYEEGPNVYWDTIQNKMTSFFFEQFKPKAEIGYSMNNLEYTFYDTSDESVYSFWDFGDGSNSTEKNALHTYEQKGIYKVSLTTCNQNMACDTVSLNISVGISDNVAKRESSQIRLYPNPVKSQISISGLNGLLDIVIYDVTGQIIIKKKDVTNSIDVSELQNGIYFIELSNSTLKSTQKIIKIE